MDETQFWGVFCKVLVPRDWDWLLRIIHGDKKIYSFWSWLLVQVSALWGITWKTVCILRWIGPEEDLWWALRLKLQSHNLFWHSVSLLWSVLLFHTFNNKLMDFFFFVLGASKFYWEKYSFVSYKNKYGEQYLIRSKKNNKDKNL